MALDNLPIRRFEAKLVPVDNLPLQPKPWCDYVRGYILAGKGEGKSDRVIELYIYVLGRFLSFLGTDTVQPSSDTIRLYLLEQQTRGLAPASVHIHYRTLKSFFNWLVAEERIGRSPLVNIRPPRVPSVVIPTFTDAELSRILTVCAGKTFMDRRNRAVVLMFLDTGVRVAELVGMSVTDVEPDQRLVKVFGKGSKERVVPFSQKTLRALQAYINLRDDALENLWVSEERRPMTLPGMKTAIVRLMQAAEITRPKRGAHTFRHTMAITYLRRGGDVFTLQKILGHSALAMTQRYARMLTDDIVKAHQKASPVDNLRL